MRHLIVGALFLVGCGLVDYELLPRDAGAPGVLESRLGPGSRVPWRGGDHYLLGASVPWRTWGNDFGSTTEGVSSTTASGELRERLGSARASGLRVIRWMVFVPPDHIQRDGDGGPAGVEPQVFTDLDEALAIAEDEDVYLVLTLFSGGGSGFEMLWTTTPDMRTRLADTVASVVRPYAGHARIVAWQVFEWTDGGLLGAQEPDLQDTFAEIVRAIRTEDPTTHIALGVNGPRWLSGWSRWGADFYTCIDSGALSDYDTLRTAHDLDGPLVVSVFYLPTGADGTAMEQDYYDRGFAGAWAWSLFPESTVDGESIDLDAVADFAAVVRDEGP